MPLSHHSSRNSVVLDIGLRKSLMRHADSDVEEDDEEIEHGRHMKCSWLPCCMEEEDAESFGHHVSIFMVALVAFATFFCVTLILILVFLLG